MSEKKLAGKTALVTGSARNIGRAIALNLAEQGASLVINGVHDQAAAEDVAIEVREKGVSAVVCMADVTDESAVRHMVETAAKELGSIDILVLNASSRGQIPFLEMSYEQWRNVIDITLDGAFFCSQACIPHMQNAGWGRIVTLGGISWHVGINTRVHNLTSKAGVTGFTRGLAVEFAPDNITANSVSPGFIETVRPATAGVQPSAKVDAPIDRKGTVDEIASAVTYLCLPESGYITGQIIHVNGGMYLGG